MLYITAIYGNVLYICVQSYNLIITLQDITIYSQLANEIITKLLYTTVQGKPSSVKQIRVLDVNRHSSEKKLDPCA